MSTGPRRLAITGQITLVISLVLVTISIVVAMNYFLRLVLLVAGIVNFVLGILYLVRGWQGMRHRQHPA